MYGLVGLGHTNSNVSISYSFLLSCLFENIFYATWLLDVQWTQKDDIQQEAYIPQKYRHQLVGALIGVEAMFKKVNLQCVAFASDPFLYQSTPLK